MKKHFPTHSTRKMVGRRPVPEFSVMVVAGMNSGKTSLLYRLTEDRFYEDNLPFPLPPGDTYRKEMTLDDQVYVLHISCIRPDALPHYYSFKMDGIVGLFSLQQPYTLQVIEEDEIQALMVDFGANKGSLMLAGTGCDEEQIVRLKQGEDLAAQLKCPYIEVSSKTGQNVDFLFYELLRMMVEDRARRPERTENKCIAM